MQALATGGAPNVTGRRPAPHTAAKALHEAAAQAARAVGVAPPPRVMCSAMPWVDCTQLR